MPLFFVFLFCVWGGAVRFHLVLLTLLYLCGFAPFGNHAWAACATPVGVEGEIIYNREWKVLQFCDGADWVGMGWRGGPANDGGGEGVLSLTTAEIKALPSPKDGQMVYDTNARAVVIYDGTNWKSFWNSYTAENAYSCPTTSGWHNKLSGCYYYPTGTATWDSARAACRQASLNTDLASIGSPEAQTDIFSITGPSINVWLGGRTTGGINNWYWVDGTPFIFTFWNTGEPNSNLATDGLKIQGGVTTGRWDDTSIAGVMRYICKKAL